MSHPLSLEAFADWLATMPADQEYDYTEPSRCAAKQYLESLGIKTTWTRSTIAPTALLGWVDDKGSAHDMGYVYCALVDRPHTFGAAHKRARMQLTSSD